MSRLDVDITGQEYEHPEFGPSCYREWRIEGSTRVALQISRYGDPAITQAEFRWGTGIEQDDFLESVTADHQVGVNPVLALHHSNPWFDENPFHTTYINRRYGGKGRQPLTPSTR